MYVEILNTPSILSLITPEDDGVNIIRGIKQTLKSANALQSPMKQDPKSWPTVKLVVARVTDDGGQKLYRGGTLRNSDSVLNQCSCKALADIKNLDMKMR